MKKLYSILLVSFLLCHSLELLAQTTVKGVVFEDRNANGKKERSEKGIPNVAVSNGREVSLTDARGNYELPVGKDNIIFVIKPAHFKLHVNEYNLPQYYYIHKPEGSPDFKYAGVEPTGPLPKSVDFALIPSEEDENFKALIFGDTQPYNLKEVEYMAKGLVAELEGIENVPFGITLGDLVYDNLELFSPYKETIARIGIPWFNVMGNHDMNYDAPYDSLSDESFESHFGPANYAFNYGKAHFIILDDILYPDPRDGQGYWGGFREDQLDFVKNNLKYVPKDRLIVLAFHIPITDRSGQAFRDSDRRKLFDMLQDYPNTLSMSAHTHLQRQDFFTSEDGWKQDKPHHHYNAGTSNGDWYSGRMNEQGVPRSTMRDGTPRGYAFLNVSGNQYDIDYRVSFADPTYQIEIFAPKVVAQNQRTSARIFANFFMGSENDEVLYRIGSGEWRKMSRTEDYDPSYVHEHFIWDTTEEVFEGRRPSLARICTHLWAAPIPVNLETGEHMIEIKATDMFGKEHRATKTYRIVAPTW